MGKYDIEKQKWDSKSFHLLEERKCLKGISTFEDIFTSQNNSQTNLPIF